MTGSLFALGLTLLMSVACATPLIEDSYQTYNNVDFTLPWFPNNYASSENGVEVQLQQFHGLANVIANDIRFDGGLDESCFYFFNEDGMTRVSLTTDQLSHIEICTYFDNYHALAGLLVYTSDDGLIIEITPYWRAYRINDNLNGSFWYYIQEDNLNSCEVYLYSYNSYERTNIDDQASFDCMTKSYSGTLLPYILGGEFNIHVEYFNPVSAGDFDHVTMYFLTGARSNDDTSFYWQGYNNGYNTGVNDGFNNGYTEGQSAGYTEGYRVGSQDGYREGYYEGLSLSGNNFNSLFNAIADTPILMVRSLFNFDLFGMNVFVAIMTMLTGIVVIYVVKKVIH